MISTVFFDADQTLWDFDAVMRAALAATLDELRRLWPPATQADLDIDALIADRRAVASAAAASTHEELRQAAFARTLGRLGCQCDGLAGHLTEYYLARRFADVEPYPDVPPSLEALRRRYRLGLLSNGNSYPERCGLDGLFDVVVFAHEHGVAKPDRRLYDLAATRAVATPRETVMIGDSLRDDVLGAQLAGWRAIWLNRQKSELASNVLPDAIVSTLLEVPQALLGLGKGTPRPG